MHSSYYCIVSKDNAERGRKNCSKKKNQITTASRLQSPPHMVVPTKPVRTNTTRYYPVRDPCILHNTHASNTVTKSSSRLICGIVTERDLPFVGPDAEHRCNKYTTSSSFDGGVSSDAIIVWRYCATENVFSFQIFHRRLTTQNIILCTFIARNMRSI